MPRPYRPRRAAANNLIQGGPGQPGEWDGEDQTDEDEFDDGGVESEAPANDPMAAINARLAALETENANLRRAVPPAAPAPQEDPLDAVDWDTELFSDPKGALKKYGAIVADQVERKLTSKYQSDRGTQRFWDDFYKENEDLKQDHDLVQATLAANMQDLANRPVPDAMKRLGELVRERILRYSRKTPGRKARVEGNEPPQPRPQTRQEPNKVVTLGDILKARREARRKGQAA